ncbi:integrase repeat-containing protein, partial [Deinococcus sp.]|uniref:integrase repeat-containing protein n=1 Tax=Deinococcus sp. TaxID=47478 RepID=UPI002869D3B4
MTRLPYAEARVAVQRLGLRSVREYQQRYAEQPGLPSSPQRAYPEWRGWAAFLAPRTGSARRAAFLPLPEAMAAVGSLGIQDQYEYRRRYREAAGVPSNPERIYADWPGWSVYLGKGTVKGTRRKCLDVPGAQQRVRNLGVTTAPAYRQAVKTDPLLPRRPDLLPGWPGWAAFLGVEAPERQWLTYAQARAAVQAQGWSDVRTYAARYREVPGLPFNPDRQYVEWQGWPAFLAPKVPRFLPYDEARRVVRGAGFDSVRAY